jgi:hypothetical protein
MLLWILWWYSQGYKAGYIAGKIQIQLLLHGLWIGLAHTPRFDHKGRFNEEDYTDPNYSGRAKIQPSQQACKTCILTLGFPRIPLDKIFKITSKETTFTYYKGNFEGLWIIPKDRAMQLLKPGFIPIHLSIHLNPEMVITNKYSSIFLTFFRNLIVQFLKFFINLKISFT